MYIGSSMDRRRGTASRIRNHQELSQPGSIERQGSRYGTKYRFARQHGVRSDFFALCEMPQETDEAHAFISEGVMAIFP